MSIQRWKQFAFLFIAWGMAGTLFSQPGSINPLNPPQNEGFLPDSIQSAERSDLPDSTIYDVFFMGNRDQNRPYGDTTLQNFMIYDPSRIKNEFGVNLGNLGSSERNLIFEPLSSFGTRYGFEQYDAYRLEKEEFQYFLLNRPFSHLSWTPGGSQENFMVKAQFSRNFAGNVNFTLDYQRVTQTGDYLSQATKSTYLGTGFWKKSEKHEFFLLGIINANNEEQNGGISNSSLFEEPFYNFRERIPTHLDMANTRLANVAIHASNFFHFTDSLANRPKYSLLHELTWDNGSYKFYDEGIGMDEIDYYGYFLLDDRGVRTQLKYSELGQKLYFIKESSDFTFRAGVVHKYFQLDDEVGSYSIHDLYLDGKMEHSLNSSINLRAGGKFGWVDQSAEFDFFGNVSISLNPLLPVDAGLRIFNQSPSVIQKRAQISQQLLWDNDFEKPEGKSVSIRVGFPRWDSRVQLQFTRLTSPIYIDTLFKPVQHAGDLNLFQISLDQYFKLWIFNFDNKIFYQSFSENLYNLPRLFSEHDIFLEGKIFKKKMLTKAGVNIRFVDAYNPAAYSPIFGVFGLQETYKSKVSALADGYISFKIDNFRAFLRFENLNHLFTKEVTFFIKDYPQFDYKIRMGVSWLLQD